MIDNEIRGKIVQMRLDGVTWKEIIEKLNLPQNANHSIYKSPWFIKGMIAVKEKRKEKKKEEKKENLADTDKEIKIMDNKGKKEKTKPVDKEIKKHIKSSDKAPANIKKKETVGSGETKETEKKKEEKKEKSSFGLWAILIIALVIGVVVILFLLKGKKAEVKEPEEEKPKSTGFEGRSTEDL